MHGSVGRDFDLIAVPWIDDAADPAVVVDEIARVYGDGARALDKDCPRAKPHGRLAWSVHLSFGDCYLDISFTPRIAGPSA